MRQLTKVEIGRLKLLTEKSVEVTLIEPTATGLGKSIMDATGSVRAYLKDKQIHNYELQGQGAKENGVYIETCLILSSGILKTSTSLYRPKAKGKGGDPRIWISNLREIVQPNDILAIIAFEEILYVVNLTRLDLDELINGRDSNPLKEIVNEINSLSREVADELLQKLRIIAARGYVPALLQANTAIGRTLEDLLGISMNSAKLPDYKGIELKSAREKKGTRKSLFGKTPDWELSKFKSRVDILDTFGYWQKGVFRLYNTIRATGRNAQGLMLRTDTDLDYLFENSDKKDIGDFLVWKMEELRKSLSTKHKETFWVSAQSKFEDNKEFFLFNSVVHTKGPLLAQFGMLIDLGAITLDYPIKRLPNGNVVDKGCNFKLRANAINLLFPPSQSYDLLQKLK